MNAPILLSVFALSLSLVACDKPTVVNVPAPVATPGPAGPQGVSGTPGAEGMKGETGKPGSGTTLIVVPPAASAATN